ncbi:MAG: tRNA threonylcarbamoyladenosine dehydratase [Alphaproteobacteria bacterium]|nr:tRNA threonylcarbamoyladenosine dehydratase [Alphaproteobacteria bacterium]
MDRLHRTHLLFGETGVDKLRASTVMVVGCGAVGSFAAEALARTGVGHIVVVDFDNIDPTNINRQLFALDSTVGTPKVDIARARIHDINPDTRVTAYNIRWDGATDVDVRPDFVIDAIDDVPAKVALYKWCTKHDIPFISSMGAALKMDVGQVRIARLSQTCVCPLAARVRRAVRDMDLPDFPVVFSSEPPAPVVGHAKNMGSNITVTGIFGLVAANYVIKKLVL